MFELESELATLALLLTAVGFVLPVGAPQATARTATLNVNNNENNPDLCIPILQLE
jgi:hypothetical protein